MGIFSRRLSFHKKRKTFTAGDMLFKFLRDGTNSKEMGIVGSLETPIIFEYVVPEGKAVWLERVNLYAINPNILVDSFFGIAALVNGVSYRVLDKDDTELIDFTDGENLNDISEFIALAGSDVTRAIEVGNANDSAAIRWTISKAGEPLYMTAGQRFQFVVSDNLSGIVTLRQMIQGTIVDAV